MKTVSAEAVASHPGCAGMFAEKEAKATVCRDWLWPIKVMVKLVLFVVLMFALPAPVSFLIILLTASFWFG
ncbi:MULTISPECIES: hypothetical protein [Vibrio harveyi group]|uniref:Uncharacterized protein n=1 Tax=Vibrio parahaemolyticus TaxID=670 RepID=A0A249W1N4_VIBPH|nr:MULTISPECIES: hypothetical protein [Vibrio harveyi group]KIT51287.1 hypothetical protein H337_22745 [Vibrio parahaemolyticus EN9701121]APP06106.1 hypothetical protein BG259_12710 [Vibrio harveyi]ASZ50685.1 hypothetical protein YA91_08605 [Vibrio parahaemolyticus]AUT85844.1 hypothetical protein RK51_002695 [Vibrio parahaemolyticus]EGF42126.1 hypothetical protein VP10329_03427 [Vibrio parahaemolyticus 10329]